MATMMHPIMADLDVVVIERGAMVAKTKVKVAFKSFNGQGYKVKLTMGVLASLFQKAVRRGDWPWTVFAVYVYYHAGYARAIFAKLQEFALEDKGRVAPELVGAVEAEFQAWRKTFARNTNSTLSHLKYSEAGQRFRSGIDSALRAACVVCRAPTSRIAAMLAFCGLSAAVFAEWKDAPAEGTGVNFDEKYGQMVTLMQRGWCYPLSAVKARPYSAALSDLCESVQRPDIAKALHPVTHHRLCMASAIVAALSPSDGTQALVSIPDNMRMVLPDDFRQLPVWALDKHSHEGKVYIAKHVPPLPDEDGPSRDLRHAFESSFAHDGHSYDRAESEYWDRVGRATYEWWDRWHRSQQAPGSTRSYSLAKTNRLLKFWAKIPKQRSVQIASTSTSTSSSSSLSKKKMATQGSSSSSSSSTTKKKGTKRRAEESSSSSSSTEQDAKRVPGKRRINVSDKVLNLSHCLAQLPTRGGKQVTLFAIAPESGAALWRKGPYNMRKQSDRDEMQAELDADELFRCLPGVEARNLRHVSFDDPRQRWLECPALIWPIETTTQYSNLLQRSVEVAKIDNSKVWKAADDDDAWTIRSLCASDYAHLSPTLLQRVLDAHVLKWALGCNDLVHRNLLVDFAHELVYPCDCTKIDPANRRPQLLHNCSREVREILLTLDLNTDRYRTWLDIVAAMHNGRRFAGLRESLHAICTEGKQGFFR